LVWQQPLFIPGFFGQFGVKQRFGKMTTRNHMIKKQVLDLTLDSEVGSFIFQSRASEFFKAKILPLIDDQCSKISGGSGTVRIDRLDIDLGVINRNSFESDFEDKFDKLFPGQLAKSLRIDSGENFLPVFEDEAASDKPGVITDEARDFEILEIFIGEGRLPWWVRANESYNISALLTRIITSQPVKAKHLIVKAANNPSLVKRLAYHVEEPALEKILEFLQPGYAREIYNLSQDLITAINGCPLVRAGISSKIKPELWSSVLTWTIASEGQAFKRQHLLETIIKHLANSFGLDFNALDDYLAENFKLKGKGIFNKPDISQIAGKTLSVRGLETEEFFQYLRGLKNLLKELQTELAACKGTADVTFSMRRLLDKLTKKVSLGMKSIQHLQRMLEQYRQKNPSTITFPLTLSGMGADLRKQAAKFEKWLEKLRLDLLALSQRDLSKTNFEIAPKIANLVQMMDGLRKDVPPQERLTVMNAGSDGDWEETFINNAGIVLLWPYLTKFFDAIGLTKEECFVDEEAAGRAALFLHYLAGGVVAAQEYELALNKILCGMDLECPVNPYLAMTKVEAKECENLLQSVIQNWPALKKMPASGLRRLFLMREGMIFYRDGHPVLRVAGQAHDILLDKMPWGIGTIKLPWMNQLLFVEWRQ
jgi:hypothetical protein